MFNHFEKFYQFCQFSSILKFFRQFCQFRKFFSNDWKWQKTEHPSQFQVFKIWARFQNFTFRFCFFSSTFRWPWSTNVPLVVSITTCRRILSKITFKSLAQNLYKISWEISKKILISKKTQKTWDEIDLDLSARFFVVKTKTF